MSIVRTKKQPSNYTTINNTILNDRRLSWQAKGLAAYLLSKPDNWEIRVSFLKGEATNGREAVERILRELESFGYLERNRRRTKQGKFEWEHILYEIPQPPKDADAQPTGEENHTLESSEWFSSDWKPGDGKPVTGNGTHIVITDNQLLKTNTENKDGEPPLPPIPPDSSNSAREGGGVSSSSKKGPKDLAVGMSDDQRRAFEMLKYMGMQPRNAAKLAFEYEFRFLLEHATAFADDLLSDGSLGAGVLYKRIQDGDPPRILVELPYDIYAGKFYMRWAREDDLGSYGVDAAGSEEWSVYSHPNSKYLVGNEYAGSVIG